MPERLSRVLVRLLRYRPFHFVAGGLLLHLAIAGTVVAPPVEPLALSPEAQARLRAGWVAAMGRAPSDAEFAVELRRALDDEILFREALEAGLHRRDVVVRQRLALNMRFLEPRTRDDEDALVVRAERMDMHRNDLVVRRRLVQMMEFALSDVPEDLPVSVAEAEQMYEKRKAELVQPARWRLEQVYFSAERRGARAAAEAVRAAEWLNRPHAAAEAVKMGDPFLGGRQLPLLTANQLEGQFGSGFAEALARCTVAVWCAPVPSSFGQHAVLVQEYVGEHLPALDDPSVRARIDADVRRQREAVRLEEGLHALRIKYGVAG